MTVPPKIAAAIEAQRLSTCSNAEPGTYNHTCGKPATWIGTMPSGWRSGFCADCKARAPQRSNAMPTGICATSSARKNAPPAKPTSRALRPSSKTTSGPITLLDTL